MAETDAKRLTIPANHTTIILKDWVRSHLWRQLWNSWKAWFDHGLLKDQENADHYPYLVSISQPEISTTNSRLIGRNTFHPSRISWS